MGILTPTQRDRVVPRLIVDEMRASFIDYSMSVIVQRARPYKKCATVVDIDKDTVDFAPNYDDRLLEPRVLPAKVPNLLVNGSSGIAVGMSTNVPPHNLAEVVRAAILLLDNPECTVEDLMVHLPGPDFPTGGIIVGVQGIRDAYTHGRGRVVMRARVYKESRRSGREQLVVTEIPYGTNKSRIIEQVAELTRAGKLHDVSDLRDESDRDGIRVVIELKRGADAARVLALLYKGTALQTTFGVIALALDNGVPRELGLKTILERYRDHRLQVVVRRSRWELDKASGSNSPSCPRARSRFTPRRKATLSRTALDGE